MKKLFIIPILLLSLVGCGQTSYKIISVDEAHNIMNDSVIIDVRSFGEYSGGHLKGAINMPYDKIDNLISTKIQNKDTKIILYCQTGVRAKVAAETLINMNYTNVYTFGGINSWTYDVVK